MGSVSLLAKFFALAFSALLPVINPLGSAIVLLGLVGNAPASVFRDLARKIAIRTTLFPTGPKLPRPASDPWSKRFSIR